MIDPDRVMQMAYLPGERVRAELGFDWEGEPTAVTAHFRRFSRLPFLCPPFRTGDRTDR